MQIIDQRSQTLQRFNFTQCTTALAVAADELDSYMSQQPHDFVLVKTHNQELDAAYLSQKSLTNLAYVGLLGPNDRTQRVKDKMSVVPPLNLVAPAGMDTGGDGPHAIALSIMTQIQTMHKNMSGTALSHKRTGIHDRVSSSDPLIM